MRICFLTQYFPPEMGAPQRRIGELAHRFRQRGHDVTVLTAMPNYPTGRVFDGYSGLFQMERTNDLRVLRSWIHPSQSASLGPRLANYFSFVGSSATLGALTLGRQDYLFVESPPLFLGLSGLALRSATGARIIFNVSDLWPESAANLGVVSREGLAYRAALRLEAACYRTAWLVTGQSKTTVESIQSRFPRVPTYHLSNGCDTTLFGASRYSPALRKRFDPNGDRFVSVYAGLHGLAQGLEQILHAAERVRDTSHRFVLIGDGPEKPALQAAARSRGLDNVVFEAPMSPDQVPAALASADAILVTLKHHIPGAVPSKIYEAMASERPLILVDEGEAAEIVRSGDAGVVVSPGQVGELVAALEQVRLSTDASSRMTRRARQLACDRFDRAAIANRFIDRLENGLTP